MPGSTRRRKKCISALFYDLYRAGRRFAAITFIASYYNVTVITVMLTNSVSRVGSFFLWTGLLYILSSLPVCLPPYVDCKTISVVPWRDCRSELTVYPVWHGPIRTDNPHLKRCGQELNINCYQRQARFPLSAFSWICHWFADVVFEHSFCK